jgi:hypothetical protein
LQEKSDTKNKIKSKKELLRHKRIENNEHYLKEKSDDKTETFIVRMDAQFPIE